MQGCRKRRVINLAIIFLYSCFGQSVGSETSVSLPRWSHKAQAKWWQQHSTAQQHIEGTESLLLKLRDLQKLHGLSRVLANEHFMKWVAHLHWLKFFPSDGSSDEPFPPATDFSEYRRISAVDGLPDLVTRSMSAFDDQNKVISILTEINQSHPDEFAEYNNLAVAMALVWDQPFPDHWPHPNVKRENIPSANLKTSERFEFMVRSHKSGLLLLDPKKLSVRELCFVVDTPVSFKELEYVQQIKLKRTAELEQLYRVVPYDQARISEQNYEWPHGEYRLIEIGARKGGICMDQSYFVAQTGKAKGVPTVLFMGQGRSGGHAWVGFLKSRSQWNLHAARWQSEKYPVGSAYDPQTWRRLTDSQMKFVVQGQGDSPAFAKGKTVLSWALLNRGESNYLRILQAAAKIMPRSFEPWELELSWLASNEKNENEHRMFWERWVVNFKEEKGMKAKGQLALLRILKRLNLEVEAKRLSRQIVNENRSGRFDLGIALVADEVIGKQVSGLWVEAEKEFFIAMEKFKKTGGGHLFYNLVEPYIQICLRERRLEEALRALEKAEKTLAPQPNSILANDLAKLRDEVN